MFADYLVAKRLPIITEPTAAPYLSRDTIPEMRAVLPPIEKSINQSKAEEKFYQNGDAPHTSDKGFEKAIAEATASVMPDDIAKRPWWTYIAGGIGAIALTGLTLWMTYDSGKTVGEAGKTVIQDKVGMALVESLSTQIGDLEAELNAVSADNETYTSDKEILKLNYSSCDKLLGETKTQLRQRNSDYVNLEQQLAAAPKVQEFVALKDRNAQLETEKEQFSIKAQEADTTYAICGTENDRVQSAYDSCVGELEEAGKKAFNVSDSRYLAIKEISESNKSTTERGEALANLVESYVKELGGVVSIAANGVCETALSNLYHAITPTKDEDVKQNFTLTLTETGICNDFKPGSKYLNLEVVDE